jgi:hypothetical protein
MKGATLRSGVAGGLVLLLLLGLAAADETDRIEPHQPIASTALLLTARGQGNGIVIDRADRLLLTNQHVVQVGQDVEAIFPIWADDGRVLVNRELYLKKGQRIRGKCVAASPDRDLALVQLPSVAVPEVKLAAKSPSLGDKTYLLACPAKSSQVWVGGVGKVTLVGEREMEFDSGKTKVRARTLQLKTEDRKMGAGASGGPVVSEKAELIGLIQSGPASAEHINCIDIVEIRRFVGEFHRKLGSAALAKKEYSEAVARCTRAVDLNPTDALAFHERGAAQSFLRRFAEAIADYTAALKLDPKLSRSWRGRGSAYYLTGNYPKAVSDCTEAIRIDPAYAQAYLSRSRAYEKLGKLDEARIDREIAGKLDPSLK